MSEYRDPEIPALSKLSKSLDPKKVATGQHLPTVQAGEKLLQRHLIPPAPKSAAYLNCKKEFSEPERWICYLLSLVKITMKLLN